MNKRKKTNDSAKASNAAPSADVNSAEATIASEPLGIAVFCPNCGSAISAERSFCTQCGTSIPHKEDKAEQQKPSEPGDAVSGDHSDAHSDRNIDAQNGEGYGSVSSAQLGTADYCTCCGKVITVNCTYCPACGVSLLHSADTGTSDYGDIADDGDKEKTELTLCEYCGFAIPFGALACSGCGASLYGGAGTREARCCPCCGKAVAASCVYCPICGESLSSHKGGKKRAFAAGLPDWNLEPQFAAPNVRLPRGARKG